MIWTLSPRQKSCSVPRWAWLLYNTQVTIAGEAGDRRRRSDATRLDIGSPDSILLWIDQLLWGDASHSIKMAQRQSCKDPARC